MSMAESEKDNAATTAATPFMSMMATWNEAPTVTVDVCFKEDNSEDLSYADLDDIPEFLSVRADQLLSLHLDHNLITILSRSIGLFKNLMSLDISYNHMTFISAEITNLSSLQTLIARNNNLDSESLPKTFSMMKLQVLNFSGNRFREVPMCFTEFSELRFLHMGGNQIEFVPPEISSLTKLEVLYLGGNRLIDVPDELGELPCLSSLALCDNRLESVPKSLASLRRLQSLSLHNNRLSTLPPEIVTLNLQELSLRNNPLVVRFVQEMAFEPPSLLELAGRVIKTKNIKYTEDDLPRSLISYLDSAQQCVNPKCQGVYFSSCVEHVKFVDFCGKYRLPLLQYLCSPRCTRSGSHPPSDTDSDADDDNVLPVANRMKKVLLG